LGAGNLSEVIVSYAGFIDNLVGVWAKTEATPFDSKLLDKSVLRTLKFEPLCANPTWPARAVRAVPMSSESHARVRPLKFPGKQS
jgi:hypothetical protein